MIPEYAHTPMSTADDIYNEVRTLPEAQARVVLDFVTRLKEERSMSNDARRHTARSTLEKYRGRFPAVKTQRDELYDRTSIR